ncbi:MAG: aromatic ring-hydroxylating dioxygenase subunit alpha [Chloroflexi bacterium]|nr:aromatic ring-hydroxylating dioxygenase subunit alpha [Chloroflexota bacterium]
MGSLFREYWLPTLLSSELPERDGRPVRVRVLGENLVAFRDTSGRIGMLADRCSHRCAPLYFGRNEEDGLRCVYHGWKYDVTGRCVDMPNESPERSFKDTIQHTAYPCQERSGVVWTYMGPRKAPPPMPALEWVTLPEEHHVTAKITEDCNWLQILEGDVDSSHGGFLHTTLEPDEAGIPRLRKEQDRSPHVKLRKTDYGFVYAKSREADARHYYWKFYQFLMPAFVIIPGGPERIMYRVTVPIDDQHTTFWNGDYTPSRPLTAEQRHQFIEARVIGGYSPATSDPLSMWRPLANAGNDYFLDYAAQRTERFSGIPPVKLQDIAMTEGEGPVMDRTQEHLGQTDGAIIEMREILLETVRAFRERGATPPGVDVPDIYQVRPGSTILPKDQDWLEAARGLRTTPGQAVLWAEGVNRVARMTVAGNEPRSRSYR